MQKRQTNILLLHKEVDGGKVMAKILSDDLRLNLSDPAIDVITALFVELGSVGVKKLLSFHLHSVLQFCELLR